MLLLYSKPSLQHQLQHQWQQ